MARGVRKEIIYTGEAAEINKKVQKLTVELKEAKEELKKVYNNQLKAEKAKEKESKKEIKEKQNALMLEIQKSGKSVDEVIAMLKQ